MSDKTLGKPPIDPFSELLLVVESLGEYFCKDRGFSQIFARSLDKVQTFLFSSSPMPALNGNMRGVDLPYASVDHH